jgi:AcrR family transcriptional regulator
MTVLERLAPAANSTGEPGSTDKSGVEARAIEALLVCIARFGLSKTTLDDVARQAECSRATIYRYFDGKHALVVQMVDAELARVTGSAVAAADEESTLADAVVALVTHAARSLVDHEALQFLLAHEPDQILGQLAFGPGDRVLVRVGDAFSPAFTRWLSEDDAQRAGDWLARIIRSYVLMPEPSVDLTDPVEARDFLAKLVIPGLEQTQGAHDG